MKKLLVILLIICLLAGGVIGYTQGKPTFTPKAEGASVPVPEAAEPAPAESEETAAASSTEAEPAAKTEPALRQLDLDALYAAYEPDEVIATVNGKEETWGTYFYLLSAQVKQITNYFNSMAAYYGMEIGWDDVAEGEDTRFADLAVETADQALRQFAAIEGFAAENGVELAEKNLGDLEEQKKADIQSACGEGATEADFAEYLKSIYLSPELYDRINRVNVLYQECFTQVYGEDGAKLPEEDVLAYLEGAGYLSANHILLMTVDPATGEALEEAVAAEKKATAEALAKELQAIEDPEALLARFAELKEQYCEDSGKVSYPDGYTFTPGTMVSEFEDSCNSLKDYEISDPVASSYGYHIIMKLPLRADALLFSNGSAPLTARATMANEEYGQKLQAYMDAIPVEYTEGFEVPDLIAYASAPEVENAG